VVDIKGPLENCYENVTKVVSVQFNSKLETRNLINPMKELFMDPQEILDRNETCQKLGISRQTLLSWIRKGKLKVWKRVGSGTNSALLFERNDIEALRPQPKLSESIISANGHSAEPKVA